MALFALKARQRSRKLCLQALYQWHITKDDLPDIIAQFDATQDMHKVDRDHFMRVLEGVVSHLAELDEAVAACLDRPLDDLDAVERAVLRMGAFELRYCTDVPYKVVIHEACGLEKQFGAQDGYQYINAVLDALAKRWR